MLLSKRDYGELYGLNYDFRYSSCGECRLNGECRYYEGKCPNTQKGE